MDLQAKRKKLLRKSTKENQIHLQIDSSTNNDGNGGNRHSDGDLTGYAHNDAFNTNSNATIATNFPKKLSLEEKKYLLAVRNGNLAYVKRVIEDARKCALDANTGSNEDQVDINCVDSLGRGVITLAIENENLEMVELLIVMGVEPKDALLHAINAEFVEAVELLLEYEELIYVEGQKYSWEKVDWSTAVFTPDITPLILAACKNNFEILKLLLERGATIPKPHHIGCECSICSQESRNDSLRHSMSRVNEYRALASPSLISLTSDDPILTSFKLSWELRKLAKEETECHKEYTELRKQCQQFAVDLLDQTRSSEELVIILNHYNKDDDAYDNEDYKETCVGKCKCTPSPTMSSEDIVKLPLIQLAIKYRQKKFIAHPHVQQLLSKIWYDGLPGFRSKSLVQKCYNIIVVAILFPVYCISYMLFPESEFGRTIQLPIMKFLVHVTSYLFFLGLLILVSQRAEVLVIQIIGTDRMKQNLVKSMQKQRGNLPTYLEWNVLIYVLGYIKQQILEMRKIGVENYVRGSLWNVLEVIKNVIYMLVVGLRIYAYVSEQMEIQRDASTAFIPREKWDTFDPELVAEALFATANILSALKLVHIFSVNPHLGPLQISLGRMFIDILKFFSIYALVLFSFACGLNQLLWYYASLERKKCFTLPNDTPDWEHAAESCTKWRSFGNLFESLQTLFWTGFGEVGVDSFDLAGINPYTRFWALLTFAAYSVLNVTVLLNLLIAMMSNSYSIIADQADVEWKFARTKLWINFFDEKSTLPSPYNVLPTKKTFRYVWSLFRRFARLLWRLLQRLRRLRRSDSTQLQKQQQQHHHQSSVSEKRHGHRRRRQRVHSNSYRGQPNGSFSRVMRALVWRYMSAKHRECETNLVTEDHLQEIKSDISGLKFHLLDALEKCSTTNMTTTATATATAAAVADEREKQRIRPTTLSLSTPATTTVPSNKKQRSWQRQLMNDFHVGLITRRYRESNENTPSPTTTPQKHLLKFHSLNSEQVLSLSLKKTQSASLHGYFQNLSVADGSAIDGVKNDQTAAASADEATKQHSQIGKCRSEESLKKQMQLQKAIDEAAISTGTIKATLSQSSILPTGSTADTEREEPKSLTRDLVKTVRFES
ncbi:transient-receptor-potential-like protein [Planococcus citri]|uniref:transient-receptor-potential-like protein n=1 Tax=Planococcus citri TaxID=170843 RepID=UPI0031FA1C8F